MTATQPAHMQADQLPDGKPNRPPVVISVYGGKGGIAKTTTATELAYLLGQHYDRSTLLVDANADQPSAQLIYNTLKTDPGYDLTVEGDPRLLTGIRNVGYQYVVLDCPPSPTEAGAALAQADLVIIPYVPKFLETQAVMRTVRDVIADGTLFRVLFTRVQHTMRSRAETTREALAGFNVGVFTTTVREYVAHEKAQSNGLPLFSAEAGERFTHAGAAADDSRGVLVETVGLLKSVGVLV